VSEEEEIMELIEEVIKTLEKLKRNVILLACCLVFLILLTLIEASLLSILIKAFRVIFHV